MIWFVTCVANPCCYNSRYNIYYEFCRHIALDVGANLCTVELAYKDQEHVLADAAMRYDSAHTRTMYVPLRTDSIMWHKENALNAAISRLPQNTDIVVWTDADLYFRRKQKILVDLQQAHQTHHVVQGFTTCLDLGPDGKTMKVHNSIGFSKKHNISLKLRNDGDLNFAHTGYVWSATMTFLKHVGGLLDIGIVGSGDRLMAYACLGTAEDCVKKLALSSYTERVLAWQELALSKTQGRIGCLPGLIEHSFHGYKKDRQYDTRTQILTKFQYSPSVHLYKNGDGIYEFADGCDALKKDVYAYFQSRQEDA